MTLSIMTEHCYAECHMQALYAESQYVKCRYAECRGDILFTTKAPVLSPLPSKNNFSLCCWKTRTMFKKQKKIESFGPNL
jgi:hypothetical protein